MIETDFNKFLRGTAWAPCCLIYSPHKTVVERTPAMITIEPTRKDGAWNSDLVASKIAGKTQNEISVALDRAYIAGYAEGYHNGFIYGSACPPDPPKQAERTREQADLQHRLDVAGAGGDIASLKPSVQEKVVTRSLQNLQELGFDVPELRCTNPSLFMKPWMSSNNCLAPPGGWLAETSWWAGGKGTKITFPQCPTCGHTLPHEKGIV